jgi:hypothetical protein
MQHLDLARTLATLWEWKVHGSYINKYTNKIYWLYVNYIFLKRGKIFAVFIDREEVRV